MEKRLRRVAGSYGRVLVLVVAALPAGVAAGAADALFGRVLLAVSGVRAGWPLLTMPFLAVAGALTAWAYRRFGKGAERGMGLVFGAAHGQDQQIPLRLVPLVMASTWLTHLTGGSAGREGVAVQIGATLSHWLGRRLPLRDAAPTFAVVGMAAGFAGLFRTPLAATVFALEVLAAGRLRYEALAPALAASLVASATSGALGLAKFEVAVAPLAALDAPVTLRLALAGLAFGVAGGAFAWLLSRGKSVAARLLPNPVARAAAMGAGLSAVLLVLWGGRYCGLGTNLIEAAIAGAGQDVLPWDWALKLALTVLTLSAGYQGGEVTPLFGIGASLGGWIGQVTMGDPSLVAALGMVGVFGAALNVPITTIMLGIDMFGAQAAGYFVIVGFVSYLVAGHAAVYPAQRIVTPKRRGLKGDAALTVEGALERHRRELEELMDE